MKRILMWVAAIIVILVAVLSIYMYPMYRFMFDKEIVQVGDALTIVSGGGGNSGIFVGENAVIVIDTKMMGNAEELYKTAKEKAGQKPIIVINTHYHKDHTSGNKYYKGSKIYIGNYDKSFLEKEIEAENMPINFVSDSLSLNLGNETVLVYNLGQAHTFKDMVVYLKNRNYLFTGDLIFNHVNPVLKKESGADVDKWMSALQLILKSWNNATIIPGHGPSGNKEMVQSMLQYFEDMKLAASNPDKEKIIKEKYADWMTMPTMASPDKTIDYIKGNNSK
jgi:cyclase